jgi:hypothetical protein
MSYLGTGLAIIGSPVQGNKIGDDVATKFSKLTPQEQRSIRSLEKRIIEHEQKIIDFQNNPTIRPGMENLPKDVIVKQQQLRIKHLETEIRTFKNNIQKISKGEMIN